MSIIEWVKQHHKPNKHSGFTIVELLIVVVVIGILAAIVTVAYTGITATAHESAVESDLANFAKKIELFKVQNGAYPANSTELDTADVKITHGSYLVRNNFYYCRSSDGQHFVVGVWAINSTRYWLLDGTITETTDNVFGTSTCDQLAAYPQPATLIAYGLHSDTGWQSWTQ